jgi:hypothetical protein
VLADVPPRKQGPRGRGTLTDDGYVALRKAGHALATSGGHLLEHRMVLFDAIGPGEHACNWCDVSVRWEDRTLEVDHLNGRRADNRRENLVPACHACNARRSHAGNPIDWTV